VLQLVAETVITVTMFCL